MHFSSVLRPAILVKRYKRFFVEADFEETGERVTAHCPNTGAMKGLTLPGTRVWLSQSPNVNRKLLYTWEIAEEKNNIGEVNWVGTNTHAPNRLIHEALCSQGICQLEAYNQIKTEVKYGDNSRIDFFLTGKNLPDCYIEVKNVHYRLDYSGIPTAYFPDSITQRGTKHLIELAKVCQHGMRAVLIYVIQREDCQQLRLARDIDPAYSHQARCAAQAGVEMLAYRCQINTEGIILKNLVPIVD